MNLLNKPCLTCRFNTDRPETVMNAKSNLLVPPIDKRFIAKMVDYVYRDVTLQKAMSKSKNLYGKDVGKKFIGIVKNLMVKNVRPFKWAHEVLGYGGDR